MYYFLPPVSTLITSRLVQWRSQWEDGRYRATYPFRMSSPLQSTSTGGAGLLLIFKLSPERLPVDPWRTTSIRLVERGVSKSHIPSFPEAKYLSFVEGYTTTDHLDTRTLGDFVLESNFSITMIQCNARYLTTATFGTAMSNTTALGAAIYLKTRPEPIPTR